MCGITAKAKSPGRKENNFATPIFPILNHFLLTASTTSLLWGEIDEPK